MYVVLTCFFIEKATQVLTCKDNNNSLHGMFFCNFFLFFCFFTLFNHSLDDGIYDRRAFVLCRLVESLSNM